MALLTLLKSLECQVMISGCPSRLCAAMLPAERLVVLAAIMAVEAG